MPIQFSCNHCNKRVQAPDLAAGKKAKCPHCEKINTVPIPDGFEQLLPPPALTPAAPKPSRPAGKLPSWVKIPRLSWRGWLIVSGLAFLLTLRTPPGPLVLLHYVALIFAVGLLVTRITQPWVPKWSKLISLAVALIAASCWGRTDYYMEYRTKFDDGGEIESSTTDYIYRSQYRPFYRDMYIWGKDGTYHAEGGFSETGKQHGRWESYSGDYRTKYEWFWYGEPVTEGEWHLRNK